MSRYFINFIEEIGEVYVKPATEEAIEKRKHGKLYKNTKRGTYMIEYYGSQHKARELNFRIYLFSKDRREYIAELEED